MSSDNDSNKKLAKILNIDPKHLEPVYFNPKGIKDIIVTNKGNDVMSVKIIRDDKDVG